MSKPKTPAPPDPKATATAQTDQSVSTALANTMMGMVNQRGPGGSLSYNQTGTRSVNVGGNTYEIPSYEAVTALSPNGQLIQDANDQSSINLARLGQEQSARLGGLLDRPVDFSGAPAASDRTVSRLPTYGASPDAPTYATVGQGEDYQNLGDGPGYARQSGDAGLMDSYRTDHSGDRKTYEDALFSRIDPKLSQQRETIQRELAGRGVRPGSAAYDRAMAEYGQTANDARYGAILNASDEQARLEGLDQAAGNFTNSARQQGYTNAANQNQYNNSLTGAERADQVSTNATNNSLTAQRLADRMQVTGLNNSTASQGFADQMLRTGRDDANANNRFAMGQQELDAQDRSRASNLNETMIQRQQPLQELLSIMQGTALQTPNFNIATPAQMATTDVAGITQQGYSNQMQAYQAQLANSQAALGGLFDLGGAFLGSRMWGKKAAATG